MTRSIERRLAYIEAQQDEARHEREAMMAQYAHVSRAELERLVMSEMTDYLVARSFPAPAGVISPRAIEQARQAFARHPACLVVLEAVVTEQDLALASH